MIGQTISERFVVEEQLGRGSMGVVYRARDLLGGEPVALKTVHARYAKDPEVRDRFAREIGALQAVSHPSVPRFVADGVLDDGRRWLAMAHIPGVPLEALIGTDVPADRIARLGAAVADALTAIHAAGLLHRDLKPSNVFVLPDDTVRVLDFGLALDRPATGTRPRLTMDGMRVGTPAYMAPEYIVDQQLDERADLYALGMLLYELATGGPPWRGTAFEVLHHAVHSPLPPMDPARHPAWLVALVPRLLDRDPTGRPRTAAEVADALRRAG